MDSLFGIFPWIVGGFIGVVFVVILVSLVTGRGRPSGRRFAGSDGGSDSSAWSGGPSGDSCTGGGWSDSGGGCDGGGGGGGGD